MPSITSTGLGSNLNVESIVQKLVSVERRPIDQIGAQSDKIKAKISTFGKIQASLSALRDAAAKLTKPETWQSVIATSSDASVVTAAGGAGAAEGAYAITVTQMASVQSISSQMFARDTRLGAGVLTLELGRWGNGQTFTPKAGSAAKTISIEPGRDSLADVREKINGAGGDVIASVVSDVGGSRLVIRSRETGADNGFRLSASVTGPAGTSPNLSSLAFNGAGSMMTRDVAAANAQFTVNGLAVASASNVVDSVIDGVTFSLARAGSSTVTATRDKEGLKKAITDFVAAYNATTTLIRDTTKYDAESKSAAILQGDNTAVSLSSRLRGGLSIGPGLGGAFRHLSDLGMSQGVNGTVTVNDARLNKALNQLGDLKQFFMGTTAGDPNQSGIAVKLRSLADQLLGIDGAINTRTRGLQENLKANGKRVDALEDRVANFEKRVRRQYTALDTAMSGNSRNAALVNRLSKSSGG
ncbi:flagellar filament capping protein FliD [Roseateles sp. MS654]|uniref:flagellar filament capping protein FliD n=1 Tax=Roseateles sp. MS654 TaxID=3412685 RepID=UPI003C30CF40